MTPGSCHPFWVVKAFDILSGGLRPPATFCHPFRVVEKENERHPKNQKENTHTMTLFTYMPVIAQAGGITPVQEAGGPAPGEDGSTPQQDAVETIGQDDAPPPAPTGLLGGGGMGTPVMIVLMIGLFYFMLIRPQKRQEKERQKMISELRAGRRVVFAGGLTGTVVEAREHTFMIEVAPGVKIEVARGAVSRVLAEGESAKDA